MKKCILIILSLWLLPALTVRAETLSLTTDLWPPYSGKNLPGNGLAVELVSTALDRAGYQSKIAIQSWARAFEGVALGVDDVLVCVWYSAQRERDFIFSDPYMTNTLVFIKRKSSPVEFNAAVDLPGRLVGVVKGWSYGKVLSGLKGIIPIPGKSTLTNLKLLMEKNLDLVLGDQLNLNYTLDEYLTHSKSSLEFLPRPAGTKDLYIAVNREVANHQQIITGFNTAMAAMVQDGTYAAIFKKHGFPAPAPVGKQPAPNTPAPD